LEEEEGRCSEGGQVEYRWLRLKIGTRRDGESGARAENSFIGIVGCAMGGGSVVLRRGL